MLATFHFYDRSFLSFSCFLSFVPKFLVNIFTSHPFFPFCSFLSLSFLVFRSSYFLQLFLLFSCLCSFFFYSFFNFICLFYSSSPNIFYFSFFFLPLFTSTFLFFVVQFFLSYLNFFFLFNPSLIDILFF